MSPPQLPETGSPEVDPSHPPSAWSSDFYRRLIYTMLFRTVLISLVLGTTLLLSWLSDIDLTSPASILLFAIIGSTYLMTLVYALFLRRESYAPRTLAMHQIAGDLLITTTLVHVTGGAQSAYTFFYPLSIIAGAILFFRSGAISVAGAAITLLLAVALLGWTGILPTPAGARIVATDQPTVELARSLGLNVAAILGVSLLASNLGAQLLRASANLASERSAAADLLTLHEDIIRSLPSGLITIDRQGVVLSSNRAAREILGRTELVGGPLADAVPELARMTRSELMGTSLEVRRQSQGREQILGVSLAPLFDHRDQTVGEVVNFEDLTDLRRAQDQAKRSERLAAVGQLAAGVAHEIRNPLASISGSVELLRTNPAGDDSKALMDIVIREIDRLNGLIGELLEYANPRPPQPQAIDLVAVCEETVQVFRQDQTFEGVEISFSDPGQPVTIHCDPEKLRQVVWNLLRNAAEAAGTTGKQVQLRIARSTCAELHVVDNGPGIPEEHRHQIFDPFFTTKSRGSGLGLATVAAIVEEMDGEIQVESSDTGAHFIVTMPIVGHAGNTADDLDGERPSSDSAL